MNNSYQRLRTTPSVPISSPHVTRVAGIRRFAFLGLALLVGMVGVQSLTPAYAGSSASTTSTAGTTYEGCPSGYLCLYKGATWNNRSGRPDAKFYYCRTENLSNWTSRHGSYINNQTGGVTSRFWSGYNGTGRVLRHSRSIPYAGWYDADFDFFPVNSITVC